MAKSKGGKSKGPKPKAPLHDDEPNEDKRSVAADSELESGTEKDEEAFEDAVDSVSVRSLTKRSVSSSQKLPTAEDGSDAGEASENLKDEDKEETAQPDGNEEVEGESKRGSQQSRKTSSSHSRRISNTSNLDNVNLDDETTSAAEDPKGTDEDLAQTGKKLSLGSITSALPAMPWSPPTVSPSKSPEPTEAGTSTASAGASKSIQPAAPAPPTRKLTSPFSWLSRNGSTTKDGTTSPPASTLGRRNTASSIATLLSNPEMILGKLDEENERDAHSSESARNSLKDRFKLLRMQQEAGITLVPGEEEGTSEAKAVKDVEESANGELPSPSPVPHPTDELAPGTVSGVKAGHSAINEAQVDWDLWQSVVYEGPAAVARTSAEELNRAIATGIPSAIRGVIWQVLAQSKNDELEGMFEDLVAKGTDKEKKRQSSSTTDSTTTNGNVSTQGTEAVASSASSVHSEKSTSNGSTSPQTEKGIESSAKLQAATAAEKKRKEKEESATIQKLEKVIRRDLGARTSYSKYAAAAGLQDGLFGVCKAYALYDQDVGYAQGMNFLIMPLLFNMPEKEAFSLLVRLMNNYDLRDLFIQDMPGLHMRLYQFERLLEDFEPALYCHLHRRGISPHLYATQWFLTLFAYRFPLQLVLRIYDLIISEGLSAILRFGIVLMQRNAATLMGISDMQQLTTYLKDKLFDVYIDKDPSQGSLLENGFFGSSSASMDKEVYRADQLVRDATEVKIGADTLKLYAAEWQEKAKAEKDRETELQELRLANQNYAVQLRKLEERVEVCDREQADLATELVHTKVENQELKDENESIKVQVAELRNVIEKQPTEIEEAWKLERDDLMKRNESVHEENRKLEQDMAELEENLVKTKMQYAEINSQHETLNRKWSDLKRQFD